MEEMPMENIKEKLSDLIHHWVAIAILVLFLFSGKETILPSAEALIVKPEITTQQEEKLKKAAEKKEEKTNAEAPVPEPVQEVVPTVPTVPVVSPQEGEIGRAHV